jgi:uncharacterized membrane protein HdeD (DUF308 family)
MRNVNLNIALIWLLGAILWLVDLYITNKMFMQFFCGSCFIISGIISCVHFIKVYKKRKI